MRFHFFEKAQRCCLLVRAAQSQTRGQRKESTERGLAAAFILLLDYTRTIRKQLLYLSVAT